MKAASLMRAVFQKKVRLKSNPLDHFDLCICSAIIFSHFNSINDFPILLLLRFEGMTLIDEKPLTDRIRAYNPGIDDELLSRAFGFAEKAIADKYVPLVNLTLPILLRSPISLLIWHLDPATIITALLHDVVEDTDVTLDMIRISSLTRLQILLMALSINAD